MTADARLVGPGAAAGAAAAVVFAAVHAVAISDIWYSLVPMMAAGAICGAMIGWSYGRLFALSIRSWLAYNASFVVALALLGVLSVVVFEPRTTMAEVLTLDGPPSELIDAALPMTGLYTLVAALAASAIFGRSLAAFGAILATYVVLVALLGLNVSVIGLAEIPTDSLFLVGELFALVVVLAASFAVAVVLLARFGPRDAVA